MNNGPDKEHKEWLEHYTKIREEKRKEEKSNEELEDYAGLVGIEL